MAVGRRSHETRKLEPIDSPAIQAQASAITKISAAIGQMDQSTQQNAAMVEETSAAARNLNTEVESLADKAGHFKLENGPAKRTARIMEMPASRSSGYASPVKPLPVAAAADWKHI